MSKLEALMLGHLKKQRSAQDAHEAKVKVVQDKLSQNTSTANDFVAARHKAVDEFHKTTKLTGREFVEALDKLHADIDADTEKRLVEIQDGSKYGAELSETLRALDQEFDAERIKIEQEEAEAAALEAAAPQEHSAEESEFLARADAASENMFQVLSKAGAKAEDLKIILGVESAEERKKGRNHKVKSNNSNAKTPAAPEPVNAAGLAAKVAWLEPKAMKAQYTNDSAKFATLRISIGGTNRPDRVVTPGKTVTSSYTTTVKTGFPGQRIVVKHKESGIVVLDQIL